MYLRLYYLILLIILPLKAISLTVSADNYASFEQSKDKSIRSFDDWLYLRFYEGDFLAGLRMEVHNPALAKLSYEDVTQRFFEFNWKKFNLRLGHFYETLGNGIIFRAFEQRYVTTGTYQTAVNIDRDIDGALINFSLPKTDFKLFSGRLRDRSQFISTEINKTKKDEVKGLEIMFYPFSLENLHFNIGTAYLDYRKPEEEEQHIEGFSSFIFQSSLTLFDGFLDVNLNAEYASRDNTPSKKKGKAVFGSLVITSGNLSFIIEAKDYKNFYFNFNDPPVALKTYYWTLLSRHPYTPNTNNEIGLFLESSYKLGYDSYFILNYTTAVDHNYSKINRFYEFYGSLKKTWEGLLSTEVVCDYKVDRIVGTDPSRTVITEIDYFLTDIHTLSFGFQGQIENNEITGVTKNWLGQIGLSISPDFTAYITTEWSNLPDIDDETGRKVWPSLTFDWQLDEYHKFIAFYGARRAGLFCTGSICQTLPSFEGLELRLYSRF